MNEDLSEKQTGDSLPPDVELTKTITKTSGNCFAPTAELGSILAVVITTREQPSEDDLNTTRVRTNGSTSEDAVLQRTTTLGTIQEKMPRSFKLAAIVVALSLSILLVSLDMTIISTAIPEITDEFKSLTDVGWYGSAFFLAVASFEAFWGKVYRYLPLKGSFLVAIFIFEIGSLICALAKNSVMLIIGRAIAGVGGAGIASGAYTLMAFAAPPDKRAVFTGVIGATYGVASIVGPILGGVFTQHSTWRWCFYINLPIGGAVAATIFLTFQTPANAKPQKASWKEKLLQFDLPGTFTLMSAVVCFLLAIQWGGTTKPWNDRDVVGCLIGFVLLVILFIVIEYSSGERALLQGRFFKNRSILMASLYIFFFSGCFFVLIYQLPLYFQSVQGTGAADSGIRTIPLLVAASLLSIVSGFLTTATGYYQPFLLLGAALTTIGTGLIYTLDIETTPAKWISYQVVAGIGIGFGIQTSVIVGQAAVDNADISTVTAMILLFQSIGGAFLVQGGQSAFTSKLLKALPSHAPGVDPNFLISIGASDLRRVFTGAQLQGILEAWLEGQRNAYIIAIALGGISFITACFSRWESIKGKIPEGAGGA